MKQLASKDIEIAKLQAELAAEKRWTSSYQEGERPRTHAFSTHESGRRTCGIFGS